MKKSQGDDDLISGAEAIRIERRLKSQRQLRSRVDNGELPIWYEAGVMTTRRSLLRAHDEQKALEYQKLVAANRAAGIPMPGRLKNVKPPKPTPGPKRPRGRPRNDAPAPESATQPTAE